MMSDKKLYADRECDELEPFYTDHVCAMTGEQLHAKSDIAAELAYRDKKIQELEECINSRYVMDSIFRDADRKMIASIEANAVEACGESMSFNCDSSYVIEYAKNIRKEVIGGD